MSKARMVKWAVPVASVAIVAAAVGAGPVIAAVQGDPALPDRTAQQLLADAASRLRGGEIPALSGTIVETASLGLPSLPSVPAGPGGAAPSALSLLSGSHQAKIWYGDAGRLRVMLPGAMSESDLIVNGDVVWWWDSAANTATRLKAPKGVQHLPAPSMPVITPERAAADVLKAADATTTITVGEDATVAGRAAYELIVTPKAAESLVKEVRLALDGETLFPLRVQVFAKGSAEPAFEIGFETVTFTPPAAENFTFTPPAGAKVTERADPLTPPKEKIADGTAQDRIPRGKEAAGVEGSGWTRVAVVPFDASRLAAGDGRAFYDALTKVATPVSGPWGSGRLLKTKLVSVLITDDGRLIAGAVTPEALYKAAG